MKLNK